MRKAPNGVVRRVVLPRLHVERTLRAPFVFHGRRVL
jgi:hypothetical protein